MSTERTLLALAAVLVGSVFLARRSNAADQPLDNFAEDDDFLHEIEVTARRIGEGSPLDSLFAPFRSLSPRGIRNNNPMNVRKTSIDWQGEVAGVDVEYETFATPGDGIRAGSRVLLNYKRKHGLDTVAKIISRYAPTTENPTSSYISAVSRELAVNPDQTINVENENTLTALATAIIRHENGQQPYTADLIRASVRRAF